MAERGKEPMGSGVQPRIEVDSERGVLIEWPDGHQSTYSFEGFRAICPCAGCREARIPAGALRICEAPSSGAAALRRIERVGRYAITPVWGDGHATGIYSWEMLRERCGCIACRLEAPAQGGQSGGDTRPPGEPPSEEEP